MVYYNEAQNVRTFGDHPLISPCSSMVIHNRLSQTMPGQFLNICKENSTNSLAIYSSAQSKIMFSYAYFPLFIKLVFFP